MPTPDYSPTRHLLRRAGFGGSHAEIVALDALPYADRVDRFLDATPPADPYQDPLSPSQWEGEKRTVFHWFERMITTPAPLHEKMTLFWHNHFTSSSDKVAIWWMYHQIRLYRSHALGNFRTLTQAMAVTPAMLDYLDNRLNTNAGQQQNFARELMELFTLGVGNYTESDVDEMARAWTGHGIQDQGVPDGGEHYIFRPELHDDGPKTIFGQTANFNGPDTIDLIFDHPDKREVAARFLARKLWSWFAYPNPADVIVVPLAQVLLDADWEIKPLLRAIFLHPEFQSSTARNGLVRNPVEFCVAVMKPLRAAVGTYEGSQGASGMPSYLDGWQHGSSKIRVESMSGDMGMRLMYPPDVSGWKSNAYWMTTSAIGSRAEFARAVNQLVSNLRPHPLEDKGHLSAEAIVTLTEELLGTPLGEASRAELVKFAATNRSNYRYASDDIHLFTLAALTPEFQLA